MGTTQRTVQNQMVHALNQIALPGIASSNRNLNREQLVMLGLMATFESELSIHGSYKDAATCALNQVREKGKDARRRVLSVISDDAAKRILSGSNDYNFKDDWRNHTASQVVQESNQVMLPTSSRPPGPKTP